MYRLLSILRGSQAEAQSRILESETEAETIEKCVFLACSTCSLKLLRPTCPSSTVGWTSIAHSQTLGRARGTPKKRREDYRSQRDGEHQENTATASTKRGSQGLTEIEAVNTGSVRVSAKSSTCALWQRSLVQGVSLSLLPTLRTLFFLLGCLLHP